MSSDAMPDSLLPLQPFLKRAEEFERVAPVVSYYCRLFTCQTALKDPAVDQKDPEVKKFLLNIMMRLESDKKELSEHEGIANDDIGSAEVEQFAMKLFAYSDREDRAGRANKKTARSFYASSFVFEVLKLWQEDGELPQDIFEKQRYARFKAADITKALKEGRTPAPGVPGEEGAIDATGAAEPGTGAGALPAQPQDDDEFALPSVPTGAPGAGFDSDLDVAAAANRASSSSASTGYQPPTSSAPPPEDDKAAAARLDALRQPPPRVPSPNPPRHPPPPAASRVAKPAAPSTGGGIRGQAPTDAPDYSAMGSLISDMSPADQQQAIKNCKYAISSLQYDDYAAAAAFLDKAMRMLYK
eukprot:Clim_evm11s229 gene=Clim_evmTU11s229